MFCVLLTGVETAALGAIGAGVAFGLSLIVAVGPQNAFVLRQGIRREHVPAVVAVCSVSDALLIAAGTGGVGVLVAGHRVATVGIGLVGICFLVGYAVLAVRRSLRPESLAQAGEIRTALGATLLACLAFTWLNPGVYVDTVVLIGPVSHAHGSHAWWFAGGAMLASAGWFAALGFGAARLAPLFARPAAWRVLDIAVAAIMTATAVRLALSL